MKSTPMWQSDDRTNWIGRTAKQTYAWYLLGVGTIDERLRQVIEAKREKFEAAAEGVALDAQEKAIATEILNSYRKEEAA